jgi:hypothetical protein
MVMPSQTDTGLDPLIHGRPPVVTWLRCPERFVSIKKEKPADPAGLELRSSFLVSLDKTPTALVGVLEDLIDPSG